MDNLFVPGEGKLVEGRPRREGQVKLERLNV
jgi:hypothetical protein